MRVAGAALGLVLAITAPAGARCPVAADAGTPPLNLVHIFCGEVRADGRAVGFHSRPGGQNPGTVSGTEDKRPDARRPGVYTLHHFRITVDGRSGVKALSTMFPDHCDAAAVIAAIRHAWRTGSANGGAFSGPSGPACTDETGRAFTIRGFTATERGRVVIVTAYPG